LFKQRVFLPPAMQTPISRNAPPRPFFGAKRSFFWREAILLIDDNFFRKDFGWFISNFKKPKC
jgi:hypothetical protein